MRFWSKSIATKTYGIITIFSLVMCLAFLLIHFFSEGINIRSLKSMISFLGLMVLFISLWNNCVSGTDKNKWFGLIGVLLIAFPVFTVIFNFVFDGFFVYNYWKLLFISLISGLVIELLILIGLISGTKVRFKWFQQLLAFAIIVLGLASVYFILESFTSLVYLDSLLIGFSVCIILLCAHTFLNQSKLEDKQIT